ncbi:MAG: hypothetical protein VX700_03645 [Pseudomonadota bacterium]|nr:hypothetical protein [Pseudomonadota bacterium]
MSIGIEHAQSGRNARQLAVVDCKRALLIEKNIGSFPALPPWPVIGPENTSRTNGHSLRVVLLAA